MSVIPALPFSPLFLFIHTPLPWSIVLCLVLYRHNLSQLLHPVKERCSIEDWKRVFQYLEIPFGEPSYLENEGKVRAVSNNISERYPNIKFYASVFVIIALASTISSAVILTGSLSFLNPRLSLLLSSGLQFVSAIPSAFAMQRYFGLFPSPPYKFHLKKNRMGSLIKYADPPNTSSVSSSEAIVKAFAPFCF